MSSINITVLSALSAWLEKGQAAYLVTVINSWGASPRPIGSLFAFNAEKQKQIGSLSGGCIEDHLIQYLVEKMHLAEKSQSSRFAVMKPFLKRYGADDKDKELNISLPCGGVLELLIEPLSSAADALHVNTLLDRLKNRQTVVRHVKFLVSEESVIRSVIGRHEQTQQDRVLQFDPENSSLTHRLDPAYRLLIVGAGDVAYYLIQAAASLEFMVTLCEPRKEILNRLEETSQSIVSIVNELPDDLIRSGFNDEFCAIVCLAHDPRVDDMALLEALENSRAFYIGAMGSAKTSDSRRKRLLSLGLKLEQLQRLHAPIGLDISSKTPPEIAISIMAELIHKRANRVQASLPHKEQGSLTLTYSS